MNFQIHPKMDDSFKTQAIILHYYTGFDTLLHINGTSLPQINQQIAKFNKLIDDEFRKDFENSIFWDCRYALHPDLGSGNDSRGDKAILKNKLINNIINKYSIKSILDLGCGDCYVTANIPDIAYTGIDLSPVQIEKNKKSYPSRSFICGDILQHEMPQHEMVICLDVLIHLPTKDRYLQLVEKCVRSASKCGLISGYNNDINFGIVFFYEKLKDTLDRLEVKNYLLTSYNNTSLYLFVKG